MPNFRIFKSCNDRIDNLWVTGYHASVVGIGDGSLHSLKYTFSHLLKGVTPISQGDSKPSKLYLKVRNTLPRMQ